MRKIKKQPNKSKTTANNLLAIVSFCFLWLFKKSHSYPGIIILSICAFILIWTVTSGGFIKFDLWLEDKKNSFADKLNLSLKHVYLEGQQHTNKEDIINSLNIKIGESLPNISIDEVKERVEKINWVKYAVVERLYPSTLSIRIIEHTPAALWQHQGRLKIIDSEGNVIEDNNFSNFSDLLILVGKDAAIYAKSFIDMIDLNQEIKARINSAIRINERRWNVRLDNGTEIKLPENEVTSAWEYLVNLHKTESILDQNISYIDLRDKNKVYIHPKNSKGV